MIHNPRALDADYSADSFTGDEYYRAYFAREKQWRHEARSRLRWVLRLTEFTRLLEVGCEAGFFLDEARRHGAPCVTGVEPAADAAAYACDCLGLRVRNTLFVDAESDADLDLICAWHVLEHVPDPAAFLEKARELLIPGGSLALEVPNIASRSYRVQGSRWANLALDHHVWHFEPSTIRRLLERCRFVVDRVTVVSPMAYARVDLGGLRQLRYVRGGDFVRVLARKGTGPRA